ncbi:F0F1 ATP synthase subunit gamma [Halomonas nitroreducens]|uniref:F0F1 ATP synthase subunit gamma n=1 Tax=Halomonas nitroreducens TaxID=447425 RepID=A0A431V8H5_9GAMM|nr:F0F1 ATP synthase subunit gamma [Halomonas nitroreducens]RTR06984.1 F0F1 ATP synthase subunit gamma [Halomonas nitroreducens]
MESLERLQGQRETLDELRTIVKTMKSLSTASIRQYEQAVVALADYDRTVELGLQAVLRDLPSPPELDHAARQPASLGVIVFGSDHGLCGRFNEDITDFCLAWLAERAPPPASLRLLAVGARAADNLARAGREVDRVVPLPGSVGRISTMVQDLLARIDAWQQAGITHVELFHHRHAGGSRYQPVALTLLPVDLRRFLRRDAPPWPSRRLPSFRMSREALLRRLVGQYLFVSLFRACAESQASEHASRRAAMQAAQRNLDERIEDVTQGFRRARQAVITAELLDVVAGFEVVAGER